MTDTVASLGFEVDSKGLDDAKQKLGDITASAKKTEDQATKTSEALGKVGSGQASSGIRNAAAEADKLAQALVKTAREAQNSVNVSRALDDIVAKTGASYTQANTAIRAAIDAHGSSAAAVVKHSAALGGLSSQSQAAAHAVRSMVESISLGVSPVQALTQQMNHLSYAASGPGGITGAFGGIGRMIGTGGVVGIAVAAATAAFVGLSEAVASASQAVAVSRGRFESLGGLKLGDQYSKGLEGLTKDLGIARDAIQPTYESLLKLVNLHSTETGVQVLGPGLPEYFDKTKYSADAVSDAIKGVYQQLKLGGSDTSTATSATAKFFDELIKKEELTGDALRELEKISPRAAQAITNAMTNGRLNTELYAKALDQVPAPISKIIDMLPRLKAGAEAAFKELENNPKTVSAAVEKLKKSFSDLWSKVTGGGDTAWFAPLTQAISATADAVNRAAPGISSGIDSITGYFKTLGSEGAAAIGFVTSAISSIAGPLGPVLSAIKSFVDSALGYLNQLAEGAASAAQKAASAIASIANGGGGNAGLSSGGSADSTNAMGDVMGGSGGSSDYSSSSDYSGSSGYSSDYGSSGGADTSAMDYGGGSTDYGYFATGGSFTVGGSGGTDSQLVQFHATPGEKVSIDTGSGGAPSVLGSSDAKQTDILSSRIANSQLEQTSALEDAIKASADQITNAINSLRGSVVASSPSTSSTTATSATSASTTQAYDPLQLPGPMGGGLAQSSDAKKAAKDKEKSKSEDGGPQLPGQADQDQFPGGNFAQGTPLKGFQGSYSSASPGWIRTSDGVEIKKGTPAAQAYLDSLKTTNASGQISNPFASGMLDQNGLPLRSTSGLPGGLGSLDSRSGLDALKDGTAKTNDNLSDANRSLKDISDGTDQTTQKVASGTQGTTSAVDAASSSITSSLSGLGDKLSSALQNVGSSITGALASYDAWSHGGGSSSSMGGGASGYGDSSGDGSSYYGSSDSGYGSVGGSGSGYSDGYGSGAGAFDSYGQGYDTGGDFGQGGSSVSDVANQYMGGGGSDYTSPAWNYDNGSSSGSSFDSGAMDYGGGSVDAGYFRTGGSFTVPGSTNEDKTPVQLHATPGEQVTITPKNIATPAGVAVSPLMLNPTANDNTSPPQSNTQTTNKNVNIYVQPGIQAEQFLRSRAQLARAM
ncbi:hypothetical protein [Bradyrhizobium sp. Bra64]|uniref:hypothetical protein n=1 Tax=Bradyrhizobium sp. Bra64 TaxID=2926009 RepID=UPI0021193216|nr:hypothetical protein [Bradyrhizobium sp. Bra64]